MKAIHSFVALSAAFVAVLLFTPSARVMPIDPVDVFVDTGGLQTARESHTATLLLDGRVLAVGGFNAGVAISTVEIFDADLSGPGFVSLPVISSATLVDGELALAGTQLNGFNGSSGSSGSAQDSSSATECRDSMRIP